MAGTLESGSHIGQYEVRGPLGKGGMASVYRAYQPSLDREVAIKVIADQFANDPSFAERFRREARSIARLRHPNILTVYDAGEENGTLYMVMELIEGETLKEEMHGKPLPLDRTVKVINQVAAALDYANKAGIIHRDIKPSNVLLDKTGRAVLSDFGIAKLAEANVQLTGTGIGVGTPDYMSPEQAMGDNIDARSDQYSLAVMLYEMLTGRPPFTGDTPIAVVMGHVSKPLPSVRETNPGIPATVEAVLNKALSKKAQDRYPTTAEFDEALQEAYKNQNKPTAEPTVSTSAATQVSQGGYNPNAPRPGSGQYPATTAVNAEAEQLYQSARIAEQQNNFNGAFATFSQLNSRYPNYKDVSSVLERYRVMGYGLPQGQPSPVNAYQQYPAGGNSYGGRPNTGGYGQPSGSYPPYGVGPGVPAPKKSSFPLVPVIIGVVVLVAVIVGIIVATSGGSKNNTQASSAATATTDPGTSGGDTPAPNPTAAPGTKPALPTIAVPTIKVETGSSGNPTAAPPSGSYNKFEADDGSFSVQIPANWEGNPGDGSISYAFQPKGQNSLNEQVTIQLISQEGGSALGGSDPVTLFDTTFKSYLSTAGATITKTEKRKVAGVDAAYATGTLKSGTITLNLNVVFFVKDDYLYLILYGVLPDKTSTFAPVWDKFLNSFTVS